MSDKDQPFYKLFAKLILQVIRNVLMSDNRPKDSQQETREEQAPPTPRQTAPRQVTSPPPPPSGQHPPQNPRLPGRDEQTAQKERQVRQNLLRSRIHRQRGWRV